MSAINELLARNHAAAAYHPVGMGPIPTLKIALLMCMDARIDGHAAFRLNPGEVHLLRNAGGVVTDDVIRSLAISQHALGTREIMIIHHTDCGLARLEEDVFRAHLATFAGYRPTWSVQAFKDPHDSVRESLRRIRDSPFLLHHDAVRGFIFDVDTGMLEEVFTDGAEPTGQVQPRHGSSDAARGTNGAGNQTPAQADATVGAPPDPSGTDGDRFDAGP